LCSAGKKAYLLLSRGSASCVSYRNKIKHLEHSGKRTRSAAGDTTHIYTHRQTDTTQSLPHIHEMHGILYSVSHVLVETLICELISCSIHSAFFDTKYCWFLLATKLLFKNHLQTRDKFTFTNFRYELRKRSSAQNELQDNTCVYVRDKTGNRKLTEKWK